ncbi:MAG: hypothetical protein CMI56_02935 [Parcubacteria group bacterium]|nr:hypothetical protein [Parcubacteria group bacterium]
MQRFFQQHLNKPNILAVCIVIVFASAVVFGINSGMDMRQGVAMTGCMFNQSADCTMGITEHINQWQQTFIVSQNKNDDILLFSILLLAGMGIVLPFLQNRNHVLDAYFDYSKIHKERNALTKLFDHILIALSDGKINPKIYDVS